MDEETEDRFTELARTRLADTLSEAARLLSGPSPSDPPPRRTLRRGVDEILLGIPPQPPAPGLVLPEPSELPGPSGSPKSALGTDPDSRTGGLRDEVHRLRADVEVARQRVEAAEARAEEHQAVLGDLRGAVDRLGRARHLAPPYERPGFAAVAPMDRESITPVEPPPGAEPPGAEPLPVVAFALGTILSQPAATETPATDPVAAEAPEADAVPSEQGPVDPTASEPAAVDPTASEPAPVDPTASEPAPVDPTASEPAPAGHARGEPVPAEPRAVDPVPVEAVRREASRPAAAESPDGGYGGYSWPYVRRSARRRFWHR